MERHSPPQIPMTVIHALISKLSSSSKAALSLNACASSFNEFEPSKSFVESFL
jgi:hypothetical protein